MVNKQILITQLKGVKYFFCVPFDPVKKVAFEAALKACKKSPYRKQRTCIILHTVEEEQLL